MARPFYPQEADDPDLDWLVSNFLYERPDFIPVECGMLPLVLIPHHEPKTTEAGTTLPAPVTASGELPLVEADE